MRQRSALEENTANTAPNAQTLCARQQTDAALIALLAASTAHKTSTRASVDTSAFRANHCVKQRVFGNTRQLQLRRMTCRSFERNEGGDAAFAPPLRIATHKTSAHASVDAPAYCANHCMKHGVFCSNAAGGRTITQASSACHWHAASPRFADVALRRSQPMVRLSLPGTGLRLAAIKTARTAAWRPAMRSGSSATRRMPVAAVCCWAVPPPCALRGLPRLQRTTRIV